MKKSLIDKRVKHSCRGNQYGTKKKKKKKWPKKKVNKPNNFF